MVLHRVCALRTERQNVRPYCITNNLINCFTTWAMVELTVQTYSHLGIGVHKKREWKKGRGG